MGQCIQSLDYLLGHLDAKIQFHALEMVLNIQSKVFYLSEVKACSRACGHFILEWMPKDGKPIQLNGAFHVSSPILQFVIASTVEAELGTLYHNCQTGIIFWLTLTYMGHLQPKPLYIATTPQQWVLQTTQSSISARNQWKWDFSGLETKLPRKCMPLSVILGKRTWLITRASTTWVHTM
jgi:hypothetical protein